MAAGDMGVEVDIQSARRAFDNLLDNRQRGRAILSAKRAAAAVIRKKARTLAPVGPRRISRGGHLVRGGGATKRSIRTYVQKRSKNVYVVAGGHLTGDRSLERDPFYARFQEFGWNHWGAGWIEGKKFMARAAETKTGEALEKFKQGFAKAVKAQLRKSGRL